MVGRITVFKRERSHCQSESPSEQQKLNLGPGRAILIPCDSSTQSHWNTSCEALPLKVLPPQHPHTEDQASSTQTRGGHIPATSRP